MKRTKLGGSDLEISRVVFGSMGHGDASDSERARVIQAAVDAGTTSIDTAPLYAFGEVERIVGRAIRGYRGQVELLSKVGLRWDDDSHGELLFSFTDAGGARRSVRRDSRPAAIRQDVEDSLGRLGCDHLDLCQIHHRDRRVPLAESLGALQDLVQEGKIRHIGVSNFTASDLETSIDTLAASDGPKLASDQLEYNLLKRTAERDIFPVAREHGVGLLAYSPLDAGSLAGRAMQIRVADGRRGRASFQPENARRIAAAIHDGLAPVAAARGVSLAQLSLAWLLHQPGLSGVIAGARTPEQAAANAEATELELSSEELESIAARFAALRLQPIAGLSWSARARRLGQRASQRLARLRGRR